MNVHRPDLHCQPAATIDWRADNDAVNDLGFAWIEQRMSGEEGDAARDAWDAARQAMAESGHPAAIDRIAALTGLSPFAEDVLIIALAAEIDGRFASHYGALTGRIGAVPASPRLIAMLLFGGERMPSVAFDTLAADAPLRRYALVRWDDAALAVESAIGLPARVRDYLCGRDAPPPDARPEPVVPLPGRLSSLADALVDVLLVERRLQLLGPPRSGRRALATAAIDRCGFGAIVVRDAPADLPALARECLLGQCGLVVVGEGDADAFADWPTPVVLLATETRGPAVPARRLPPLSAAERREIWPDDARDMAEHFALAPHEIAAVAAHPATARMAVTRELSARDLAGLATRIIPERGWDDMVLAPTLAADLAVLSAMVDQRALVHRGWGFARLLGRADGTTAMFAGPSGVGKTMAAEAIAGELGLDLFTVDLSRIASKYIGETEKNLAQLFDAAQAGGCVLFFDEADALFGKRSEVKDSHDRYANAEISYLLQRMERFSGLAILATNLKSHLDTAFLRRITMVIDFALPDHDARLALWRRALPESAPLGAIDWAALARADLSPANIVTIAAGAAFRAARAKGAIGMAELDAAMAAEFRKLDRDPAGLGR